MEGVKEKPIDAVADVPPTDWDAVRRAAAKMLLYVRELSLQSAEAERVRRAVQIARNRADYFEGEGR